MTPELLPYDFPKGNPSPFNLNFDGNFFVIAQKYSNLSNSLDDFNMRAFEANIPMGYKTIIVCGRKYLVDGNGIKKLWGETFGEKLSKDACAGKFILTANKPIKFFRKDWGKTVESYVIHPPMQAILNLEAGLWTDFPEAQTYAIEFAKKENCAVLISMVLDSIYWH